MCIMHIERYGRGEDRIFFAVHGWAGNHRTFRPLTPYLPENASLFAVDLPGYGASPRPPVWRMDHIVDGLVDAAKGLPGGGATFMGLCSGAVLALMAADKLRERVTGLVMIDPFAYVPPYFRVFLAGRFGRYAYDSTFANPLGRWLTNRSLAHKRTAASDLTHAFARVDHDATLQYLRLFSEVDALGPFKALRLPIELIYGERTFKAVKKSVALWRSLWPQARVWSLPGAGHQPIEEKTPELAAIVFASAGQRSAEPIAAGAALPASPGNQAH